MDSSVALGGALVLLGVVCSVVQLLWTLSDRRKEAEAEEEGGGAGADGDDPPTPPPDRWDRLPVQTRL